ncbi:conserved hypothetical protein [Culex quinquefasciatus]|uniref:GDNF/GAS1 domain-containing protein n=1 Tax=Culex quinquefasciatus TaxID=7176 RepID=B0WU12_CULQU|nr:conserved hypothetical protein [Culex quinquefasciatus]|eukprot:XP_001857313.1 conserved hypothetical protein [Culex quinquefasciatus]
MKRLLEANWLTMAAKRKMFKASSRRRQAKHADEAVPPTESSARQKDPYPVDALPTCNHALSVCQQERKCIKLFEDFKTHCKVRENKCRMEDRINYQ